MLEPHYCELFELVDIRFKHWALIPNSLRRGHFPLKWVAGLESNRWQLSLDYTVDALRINWVDISDGVYVCGRHAFKPAIVGIAPA